MELNIQWYPGHMARTRRQMAEDLKLVDLVAEMVDARIPVSSRNPDLDDLTAGKPRLIILNRTDQADPGMNRVWAAWFRERGVRILETDARSGAGVAGFSAAARALLKDTLEARAGKGQAGRPIRAMVVGVPNVGKSTWINKVAGRKSAKAGDRPGVTRGKQWISVDAGLELLDTPGILWPKFEDERTGLYLAYTGAIRDEIMDTETLACHLAALLGDRYPDALAAGYRLDTLPAREPEENEVAYGYRLLQCAARRRGMKISGGEWDTERMAGTLLNEFRSGRLGRFTLESPEDLTQRPAVEQGDTAPEGADGRSRVSRREERQNGFVGI